MEESETSKDWYLIHEGDRSGPYSIDDLKAKVELHEIHPRLDKAWKDGMENWIPAGEVDGLFKKNTEAEAAEKNTSAINEFEELDFEDSEEQRRHNLGSWPGISRSGFIFFCYIFPIIWIVGLLFASKYLATLVETDLLKPIILILLILPFPLAIVATLKRFQNLGMSRVWFLGLLVPLLNIWLGYRLLACPAGYVEHKKLGTLGWVLAILYWAPLIASIGFGALLTYQGPERLNKLMEENREQFDSIQLKLDKLSQTPEEEKAEEVEEKGPSIIPIR